MEPETRLRLGFDRKSDWRVDSYLGSDPKPSVLGLLYQIPRCSKEIG